VAIDSTTDAQGRPRGDYFSLASQQAAVAQAIAQQQQNDAAAASMPLAATGFGLGFALAERARIDRLIAEAVASGAVDSGEELSNNRRAVPMPVAAARPGPADWCQVGAAVFDGDYVSVRNKAWGGVSMGHSAANKEVRGVKLAGGDLGVTRMDNDYTFCIRRMTFDSHLKAFVLPHLLPFGDREPISKNDFVVLLCVNTVNFALGTRKPPPAGNNGDYRLDLRPFPLVTNNDLNSSGVGEKLKRMVSLGLWNNDKNHIDFLTQACCIWVFHSLTVDNDQTLRYGTMPLNIRNYYTDMKQKEASIWEAVGPYAVVPYLINKTFNGGRNMTQAAGSDGSVVKLALHNNDTDDKAGWIVDSWHGAHYPVQRVLIPRDPPPPPPAPEDNPNALPQHPPPDLSEQIAHPPPHIQGLTYDPFTGTQINTQLSNDTIDQDRHAWWEELIEWLFGVSWSDLNPLQQVALIGVVPLMLFLIAKDVIVKEL
jgi:hypothetical protein